MQTFRQFLDQSKRQQLNELRQANRNKAAAQNQQAQAAGSNIDFWSTLFLL